MSTGLYEVFTHGRPWNENDYFALGETADQVELIDGSLWISFSATVGQSKVRTHAVSALMPAAEAADFFVTWMINLRLRRDRIVNPDIIVTDTAEQIDDITDAANVVLIGEILSESSATFDKVQKMQLYAEANIGWYLLVEPDLVDYKSATLRLLRLDGDRYVEHAVAEQGETLASNQPFPFEIRTEDLVRRR